MRAIRCAAAAVLWGLACAGPVWGQAKPDDNVVRAREAIAKAVEADPANPELWLHLGLVENKLGNLDAAEKAFTKVAALDASRADAQYMLGLVYEKRGDKAKAAQYWEACLKLATDPHLRMIAQKHLDTVKPPPAPPPAALSTPKKG